MWVSEGKNRNTTWENNRETVIRSEVPDYIAKNQKWSHSRQNTEETDNASELMKERKKKWLKCSLWLKTLKQ